MENIMDYKWIGKKKEPVTTLFRTYVVPSFTFTICVDTYVNALDTIDHVGN